MERGMPKLSKCWAWILGTGYLTQSAKNVSTVFTVNDSAPTWRLPLTRIHNVQHCSVPLSASHYLFSNKKTWKSMALMHGEGDIFSHAVKPAGDFGLPTSIPFTLLQCRSSALWADHEEGSRPS
jgi:hypothetical protein